MKVLLDECLPNKLKREVMADLVKTVPDGNYLALFPLPRTDAPGGCDILSLSNRLGIVP